ncbi:MAG: PEP-CTERM sorting domain-containing protein [Methylobacteriaceae bacterium]|nr:PEP-CTERM sorting domain-containing protein [Methylobacteriaceae bacterium]
MTANAGQIKLDVVGAPDVLAWCVDIYHTLRNSGTYSFGPLVNDSATPTPHALSAATIGKIGALVNHGDDLIAAASTLAQKRDIGAAIQLAIWKTEYSGLSYTASGAVTGLVNTYLGNIASGAWAPDSSIRALTFQGNGQTLVTGVPEPSTWAMMLIGFLGLAMATSRRRKEAALAA